MTGPTLTGLSEDAKDVLTRLSTGDTVTQRDLAYGLWGGQSIFGSSAIRRVQAATQELRLARWPIVSDGDGMRLSDDPAEVRACAESLRQRAITQWRTSRALRAAGEAMAMPATLWEGVG